jgi:sugar lactone lactonase YvrE
MRNIIMLLVGGLFLWGCQSSRHDATAPRAQRTPEDAQLARAQAGPQNNVGRLELAVRIDRPMPTGVTLSRDQRMFVNFPRWGDPVEYTVAEIRRGEPVPYPDPQINQLDPEHVKGLVSVQSVVVDPQNRLWILDTGNINFQPIKPGAARLICVDLSQDKIVKTITFPPEVALPTTYLNDVRFDLKRGEEGMAFITDSSDSGPNGIIVVDLKSGQSWRKLNDHPSTKADPNFVPTVEGQALRVREPNKPEDYIKIGADGIAIDADKGILYYCPLASRRLHSVSLDALADRNMPDEQVAQTIKDLGQREFASDGLACDARGRLYLTDYEHNAIRRRNDDGSYEIIAQDPRMIWPDSISIGVDGYLYCTANQLNRQPRFHNGRDLRNPPYVIFRTPVDAQPVAMRF